MYDDARKAAEKKAREEAWWAAWWDEDFSWDGLADKPWRGWSVTPDDKVVETADAPEGSRAATLQDYCRMDPSNKTLRNDPEMMNAGLLVEIPDQPTFHIIHLPVTNKDSSNTWKADLSSPNWLTLETEVMRLIADGAPTECNRSGNPLVTERRTVLSGAVLRTFPRPLDGSRAEAALPNKYRARPLHVTANRGALLGDCEAGRMEFASPANFAAFGFFGAADFKHAQFSTGRANFADAQFSGGDASFTSAQFSGGLANFKFAQFSGGYANFKYAQFSGEGANFAHAQFAGGYTSFTHAQFFGGHANFKCAQFSGGHANFKYALFSDGNTNFTNAQFSSGSATFSKCAIFLQKCQLPERAILWRNRRFQRHTFLI